MSIRLRNLFFFFSCFLFQALWAQNYVLTGVTADHATGDPVIGVSLALKQASDSSLAGGTASDADGNFVFSKLPPGSYLLEIYFVGYEKLEKKIFIAGNLHLDTIRLKESTRFLSEIEIKEVQTRVTQKDDTTEYHAGSYKVNPDADAGDLVKKMPGITVENGVVKAQGEEVKKVTVDGQEFFGDDAIMALKNLPAEIVDKIQVFDRQSDQAQFTGIDDGNSEKTINIVTRSGKSNGQFGKAYIGYGSDERFQGGFNFNIFNGKQRISLLGLSNNINQQNFSSEDIIGAIGNVSTGRGPGGGGRGQASEASNFMIGQQNGINTTHSYGINYMDQWGKLKVSASYFFSAGQNRNNYQLGRTYFLNPGSVQQYRETRNSESDNYSHRINMRFDYTIDSNNSILFVPRISFQNTSSQSLLQGNNFREQLTLNRSVTGNESSGSGLNMNNMLLYRHRFLKKGRTFSLNLNQQWNARESVRKLYSLSEAELHPDSMTMLHQQNESSMPGSTYSASLMYTEPMGEKGIFQLTYSPAYTERISTRYTFDYDSSSGRYSILDTDLSNDFNNRILTQRAGAGWRYQGEKSMLMTSFNYQHTELSGNQVFPAGNLVRKNFSNVLPFAVWRYRFSKEESLRINYRSAAQLPDVSQLQALVDNSNPLLLSSGNPDLEQAVSHTFTSRYNLTRAKTGRSFYALLNGQYTGRHIGTATWLAATDTLLGNGILLGRGGQYSRPENLGGSWKLNSFFTWGTPVISLKSNLNVNAGITYAEIPGKINDVSNFSRSATFTGGWVLGSNISEDIDFSFSYSGNYVLVKNSIQPSLSNNYYYHLAGFKLNYLYRKKLLLNSDLNYSSYLGLNDGFNQDFVLWNLALGYKFLKNNAGELRFSAFDVLGQNASISRTVTETYVQDLSTRVLTRYFMIGFIYQFRNFNVKG